MLKSTLYLNHKPNILISDSSLQKEHGKYNPFWRRMKYPSSFYVETLRMNYEQYTNGIKIGQEMFCVRKQLGLWLYRPVVFQTFLIFPKSTRFFVNDKQYCKADRTT